jgi:hypothetical protein
MEEDQDGTPDVVSSTSDLINTHEHQRNRLSASSTQMRRGEVSDDVQSQNSSQLNIHFNQMTEKKSMGQRDLPALRLSGVINDTETVGEDGLPQVSHQDMMSSGSLGQGNPLFALRGNRTSRDFAASGVFGGDIDMMSSQRDKNSARRFGTFGNATFGGSIALTASQGGGDTDTEIDAGADENFFYVKEMIDGFGNDLNEK